jgi:glycosyltransferase involved in cell wall biosynthesis
MKILQIISRMNVGGTSAWIKTLNSQLEIEGNQTFLIYGATIYPEIEASSFHSSTTKLVPGLGKGAGILSSLHSFAETRKEILRISPDVVNTHTSKAGLIGRLAVLSLGRNRPALVHTFHGHVFSGYFSKAKVFLVLKVERVMARFTDLVLVAGVKVKDDLVRLSVAKSDKYRIVFPGVSYQPQKKLSQSNDSSIVIGWLGRITQVKRPDRVIELAIRFPHLTFNLGGNGDLIESLQNIAPKNVNFIGWTTPEMFWPTVDVALLTSDNEAMPYSLIEAGIQGLPAVTTNVGSTSEVVLNGETGLVVEANTDSLASAILELISDSKKLSEFGLAAKSWTSSKFTPKEMALSHIEYYKEAIALNK